MSNLNFDEFVKKQFSGYSPEVPAHLWDQIAAKRKKRRGGFWWSRNFLLLLGVLAVVGGTIVWVINSNDKTPIVPAQTSNGSNNEKNNLPGSGSNNSSTTTDQAANNNNLNTTSQSSETAVTTEKATAQQPVSADIADYPSSKTTNDRLVNSEANYTANYSASDNYTNRGRPSRKTRLATKRSKAFVNADASNAADSEDDPGSSPFATHPATGNKQSGAEHLRNNWAAMPFNAWTKKTNLPLIQNANPASTYPKCPRVEDPAGDKQYFEFYGGPDLAIRSMTDTGNTTYLQKRKDSEKFSSAFSAGLRYTRVFGNGVSLRTGINYSQINEKFTYSKGGITQYVYTIDQTTGDTIGSYMISGTRYKTTYNRYRSIDIPLQIGYEMGNGRLHANIGAGVMINVYSWQKGDVLDTAMVPVSITTGKSSQYGFKTNTGMAFLGSASIYYKLTDRFHLFAEPYFRYSIKPMNKETFTLTQKYSTAGIRLGVRFDLK